MRKHDPVWKKIFTILFCAGLLIACKNEKKGNFQETEKPTIQEKAPITSEEIARFLSGFSKDNLLQYEAVIAFYKSRNYTPLWENEKSRSTLIEQLRKAGEEGLSFKDYHGEKLQKLHQAKGNLESEKEILREILLTDAFFTYAHDLYYGKLNPKEMYAIWGIERKQIDPAQILKDAVKKENIAEALSNLKPQNEIYKHLKESLGEYRTNIEKDQDFVKIATGKSIQPGDTDPRIPNIAARLKQLGLLAKNHTSTKPIYDEPLQTAILKFQGEKRLATDKIIGNSTIQELNMGAEERYHQILVNLERWRWNPREMGKNYFLINIPDFKLRVVKNGKILDTYPIITGTKGNKTPIFSDSIQYIVTNPEWNIPSSIRNKEIIPSAANNPNYLASRNIYVTGRDGIRVDPSSIDWSGNEARNYRFTQGAGPSNSLGKVKIIYPNQYAIYLHDTPAQAIFKQNSRAESHGCVRVHDAVKLAAYTLNNQEGWSFEKLREVIKSGETKRIKVTQPIGVYHLYWTAWREDGKTIFAHDIYNLDKAVYTALTK